jgi:hypothetical protein
MALGIYSHQFIFFGPYKWVQEAEVLHYSRLEWLAGDKCSCLLDPFVLYELNKV